jgi:hypothetical protein
MRCAAKASALAAVMAVAAGLAGCASQDLAAGEELSAIGVGVAVAPVAVPVVQATQPVARAVSAATNGCVPDFGAPVFSPGGAQVAILGQCPGGVGLDILVGPVRDGAGLTRHPIHRFAAQLGEFTSATTLTWLTRDDLATGPIRPKASNTLFVYEHDLTTNGDRLVASATAPFNIVDFVYRRGEGCAVVKAHDVGGTPSRTYLLRDGKLRPAAVGEGPAWPVYWDSVQKAFVFRLGEATGPHPTPVSFAKLGCDGEVEALPVSFAPDGSPLRDIYQAVSLPGVPLVVLDFLGPGGGVPLSGLGRLDLAAAARTGTPAVDPVPQTWPPPRETSLYTPVLSPGGKYIGLDFAQAFYVLRASDNAPVFHRDRPQSQQFAKSAFTPDETRYVLVGGQRVEVYPIDAKGR